MRLLNWLACHLVALGFLAFFAMAILLREPMEADLRQLYRGLTASIPPESEAAKPMRASETELPPVPALTAQVSANDPSAKPPPLTVEDLSAAPTSQLPPFLRQLRPKVEPPPPPPPPGARAAQPSSAAPAPVRQPEPKAAPVAPASPSPLPIQREYSFRPSDSQAADETTQASAQELLQAARRDYWNGQLDAAAAGYRRLIERFPEETDAYGELGNIYAELGDSEAAEKIYQEAARKQRAQGQTERAQRFEGAIERLREQAGRP